MKAVSLTGLALALLAIAVTATTALARPGLSAAPRAAGQTVLANSPTGAIQTSGSAVLRVQPDRAAIRFGVQTFGASPRAAQAESEAIMKRVYQALLDQGVEARDIGTDYFSVRPQYDYPGRGKPTLVGDWSENAVQVTLRQVDGLSDVLIHSLEAGATSVDDLTFTTTRLRELRDQARVQAVQAAIEKAQALAAAAHVSAGAVTNIQEQSSSYYYGQWNNRGQAMNQMQNVMQELAPSGSTPAIDDGEFSLGQIVVQAQVDVTVGLN